jgi:TusA-related sulfurtransferase
MLTFDLRENLIPFCLLQVANAFRAMKPGEEMQILAGVAPVDAAILKDVMLILPRTDYDLLSREKREGENMVTRLILRKKQSLTTLKPKGDSSCQQST